MILFARTGQIDLLRRLLDEVLVPPAVADESFRSVPDRTGASILSHLLGGWLREVAPRIAPPAALTSGLHPGDAQAIVLAIEHDLPLVIDERTGRRIAHQRGVRVIGSAGLVLVARRRGLVKAVKPRLDMLVTAGLRLAPTVYRLVLEQAGELPPNGDPS